MSLWRYLVLLPIGPARKADPALRAWLLLVARGGPTARKLWILAVCVLGPLFFAIQSMLAAAYVHRSLWEEFPDSPDQVVEDVLAGPWVPYATVWAGVLVLVLFELAAIRLVWLWMGARRALLNRDRCPHCGHGLAGLPINEQHQLTCPECGRAARVVAAWGEAAHDARRGTVFAPAQELVGRFWTRRRTMLFTKFAGAALVAVGLFFAARWSLREVSIRSQAALAAKERPGAAAINAKVLAALPRPPADQPLVTDLAKQISDRYKSHVVAFAAHHKSAVADPERFYPDPSNVTYTPEPEPSQEQQDNLRYSILLIEELRSSGLFDLIDQLPAASPWSNFAYVPPDGPPQSNSVFRQLRDIVRICAARMKLARDARDLTEFTNAMRAGLAAAHAADPHPTIVGWLLGQAMEEMILSQAAAALLKDPEPVWVDAIALNLPDHSAPRPLGILGVELDMYLDMLAWFFSDPARVRQGLDAPELSDVFGAGSILADLLGAKSSGHPPRLGTYTENRDAVRALFQWESSWLSAEPWQRSGLTNAPSDPRGLVLLELWDSVMGMVGRKADERTLTHRSLLAMIDLERHRHSRGEYPSSLDFFAPATLTTAFTDPYSGRPFGYRRLDTPDAHGRGYLLWTVGKDGIDNGGLMGDPRDDSALTDRESGRDYILNHANR